MRRRVVRRFDFSRLVTRPASFWRNVNRHFEATRMGIRIHRCASDAIRHVGAPDAICCVVDAAHNAFVNFVEMVKAALIVVHAFLRQRQMRIDLIGWSPCG
jgi:hypothetical protein